MLPRSSLAPRSRMSIPLIALKPHRYDGRLWRKGQTILARSADDALVLTTLGVAVAANRRRSRQQDRRRRTQSNGRADGRARTPMRRAHSLRTTSRRRSIVDDASLSTDRRRRASRLDRRDSRSDLAIRPRSDADRPVHHRADEGAAVALQRAGFAGLVAALAGIDDGRLATQRGRAGRYGAQQSHALRLHHAHRAGHRQAAAAPRRAGCRRHLARGRLATPSRRSSASRITTRRASSFSSGG